MYLPTFLAKYGSYLDFNFRSLHHCIFINSEGVDHAQVWLCKQLRHLNEKLKSYSGNNIGSDVLISSKNISLK